MIRIMKYYISVFPGLAGLAAEEIKEKLSVSADRPWRLRSADLLPLVAPLSGLLSLRLAEDAFAHLGSMALSGRPDDLKVILKLPVFQGALTQALGVYVQATGRAMPARPRFRVVVQAEDVPWRSYRRVDIQTAAEAAILRSRPGWRLTPDEAPLEIWLQQAGRTLIAGLRLTSGDHRTRGGRAMEREAALRPTIAAAMVFLSQPAPDDIFLDPMCGSGTILLERAMSGRYKCLLGGDNDAAAVKAALANFGPRHQPREILKWDARALHLADASVDAIACNLPWGRQIGAGQDLAKLYQGVLVESQRVIRPGGRMVLLTSEWQILKQVIKALPGLTVARTVSDVSVLGRRADMFVVTV
jgi:tRNA (guanine6-N2)-methyltransferase